MDENLFSELKEMQSELLEIRHDIHAHPELAMQEERTSKLVAKKLKEYGLIVTEGVGGFGVVGTLISIRQGKHSIGLHADMDALPLTEQTNVPYTSIKPGVMHACGHDGHIVMLLGAAKYLSEHRNSFCGTVRFIFQPAEQKLEGALAMIKDKLFERFRMDAVYGLHNVTDQEVGKFGIRPGPKLAAPDCWLITFHGAGGHGGVFPHLAADVTTVLAHFILSLQTIVSSNISSTDSAVISIGGIQGGSIEAFTVMPSEIKISGTARSSTKSVRDTIEQRIKELAHSSAQNYGCTAKVEYHQSVIPLLNHAERASRATKAAESLVGKKNVDSNRTPVAVGEDFAFMLDEKPGAFIEIGNGTDGSTQHSATYNFNDECIPFGVGYWIHLVRQELNG